MARRAGRRAGAPSGFRQVLLGRRAEQWSSWATPGMAVEHDERDQAIAAGEPVALSAAAVYGVLFELGDKRAEHFSHRGTASGCPWLLGADDSLTPLLGDPQPLPSPQNAVQRLTAT